MNIHTIHGRLTRDPELSQGTEPNKDRCNFSVAVSRRFGDETDFFDCVMFGKRAGVIKKYFFKGSEIAVTGEGQIRSYEDKSGNKRKSYSIVVSDFDFIGSSKNESKPDENADSWDKLDEDMPF